MTTDAEGLIEPRIIMRAGQCGKHQRALCSGCLAAWESNDHRIQTLEAEVERLSAIQQPDERDAELRSALEKIASGWAYPPSGTTEPRYISYERIARNALQGDGR